MRIAVNHYIAMIICIIVSHEYVADAQSIYFY